MDEVCGERRLQTVAVYCGAKHGRNSAFTEHATKLGTYLGQQRMAVVYGGSRYGLLGKMADAVLQNGGSVTGIIPEFFTKFPNYEAPGEEIVVPDMHTRKKMIFDKSEAFIALPGGIGTMEELTEILTWAKLELHEKPVGLLNTEGYYDHFLQWLSRAIEEGFIGDDVTNVHDLMVVSSDPKDLVDRLCQKWVETGSTHKPKGKYAATIDSAC